MGNKVLRPDEQDPLKGFDDQQLLYLSDKFEIISNEKGFIEVEKLAEAYQCSREQADRILHYIDFEGEGEVDFYEFKCAAASLHQNDDQACEMIFQIYAGDGELNKEHFDQLFKTVYRYLNFINLLKTPYVENIGERKFAKYDYNNNGSISLQEFRDITQKDPEVSLLFEVLGFKKETDPEVREQDRMKEKAELKEEDFTEEEETGEEAGSTPSWVQTVKHMAPPNYDIPKELNAPPATSLEIGYIYGYRSYDTRNNLRYSPKGEAVYHTAAVGIVLDQTKNTMKTITIHNDDITSLDTWNNIVVTAEMGRRPLIAVWNCETMEVVASFKEPLECSISNVAISPNGKYLAATSMSDKHEIAVYDIANKVLVSTGNGPRSPIFALKFTENSDQVVCGCAKEVVFASFANKAIKLDKGIFGKVPIMPTYSLARVNNYMISGMNNGNILLWKGNSCTKPLKQHNSAVTALTQTTNKGLISGDSDGNIVIWSNNLTVERKLSIAKLITPKVSNQPRIIALAQRNGAILVGTRGGEIIEVNMGSNPAQGNVIMEGHYDKELWGLTVLPNKNEIITAGEDRLLMRWDMGKRRLISKKLLEYPVKSVDYSEKTNMVAVGFKNGVVGFYELSNFKSNGKISNHKNPDKQVVSIVKYSPNGQILAVGYCPPISKVYFYNTANLKKVAECKGSPSRIDSVDFSSAGDSIMVNNTSYEILFYNTKNGQQARATEFKSERWASLTCRYSWMSQGIWPKQADGSDINALDRSRSGRFLATGDDFSHVKLFNYPVCVHRQFFSEYKGHSSHITGVKWSFDDKFLVTIGGLEKSIIQWNVDAGQNIVYEYEEPEKEKEEPEEEEQYQIEPEPEPEEKPKKKAEQGEFEEDQEEGEEALAIKPYEGQVRASTPSKYSQANPATFNVKPKQDLKLSYAWGIRNLYIKDEVRNQLKYNQKGTSCIFITACLGVEMDIKSLKQDFYNVQKNDLIAMAITPNREVVATGQMAEVDKERPKIPIVDVHVWSVNGKKTLSVFRKCHQRAIVVLEFSPDGQILLTIGQDDKNTLKAYTWQTSNLCWQAPTSKAKATAACFMTSTEYATTGLDHIKFWNKSKAVMGKVPGKWDPMLSVAVCDKKYISGSASGALYVWTGGAGTRVEAHKKNSKVHTIFVDSKKNVYSGADDGIVMCWKMQGGQLSKQAEVVDMGKISKFPPGILSIDINKSNQDKMLICTQGSEIYEVPIKKSKDAKCLLNGHYEGELWACSFGPDSKRFVSAGDDKSIRMYDIKDKKMLYSNVLKNMVRAIDWEQSKGELIVVGDYKGKIFLYDDKLQKLDEAKTRFSVMKPQKSTYWIQDVKFSPNGKYVAFGAHGGRSHIEVFEIADNKFGKQIILNVGFTSALLHLDWNKGSDVIAAVSQAYQFKFASVNKQGKNSDVSASSMKQQRWATCTCKFGYAVKGIWPKGMVDYSDINTVCSNNSLTLLATGADDQLIRLYKYPAVIQSQTHKEFYGHASHVTRVRFSNDEDYLVSTGGNDRTILLWDVVGASDKSKKVISQEEEKEEEGQKAEDGDQTEAVDDVDVPVDKHAVEEQTPKEKKEDDDEFGEDNQEGEQFMAVKPWEGAIKEPTEPYYKGKGKKPNIHLELEYAYGYRTKDCRSNLRYLTQNLISYHTAGIGVVMDISTSPKTQTFFIKHTDDILSICWSPDKQTMYTGQLGPNPMIYEWDSEGKQGKSFKGLKKGVVALDCNNDYLVGAAMDDDHYVMVFDRKSGAKVCTEKGGREFILCVRFTGASEFVSVGVKHFKKWEIKGSTLKTIGKGQFGKSCNILCCAQVKEGQVYVGAGDGSLQVWSGASIKNQKKLHSKPLDTIRCLQNVIMTGGKDSKINILKAADLEVLVVIQCDKVLKDSLCTSVRALDAYENRLLIGTLGSEIYEITCDTNIEEVQEGTDFSNVKTMMTGHYCPNAKWTNEVWGLSTIDDDPDHFFTCSDDATLRMWDLHKKQQVIAVSLNVDQKNKKLKMDPRTGDFQQQAKGICVGVTKERFVLVGCKEGSVRIFDDNLKQTGIVKVSQRKISDIKVNRENNIVAIGAHDQTVYVYGWNAPKLSLKFKMKKHSSYISHLDFSCDGNYLHSTCGAYQLLFWDVNRGQQCTSGATALRNESWNTWTTTLGWPVKGIWAQFMDGTDINAVDRSRLSYEKQMKLLASGNDRGQVVVFEYPCIEKNSEGEIGRGHSSHVTNVKWTEEDKYIISTGGEDQTIMQWRIEKE